MSNVSMKCQYVVAMLAGCMLLGIGRGDDKPVAGSLAHFRFNGDGKDANKANPNFELINIEFKDNAIYLDGRDDRRNIAACNTQKLDYEKYSVALRFKAESFDDPKAKGNLLKSNLITGGRGYRWFGLERSREGNLVVTLNNGRFRKEIKGAALDKGKWTVVSCSVDVAGRKVIAAVNGKKVAVIDLPKDFVVEVAKSEAKDTDKWWLFTDFGSGNVFHGLVDELIIFDRALSAEELEKVPLSP